VQTKNYIDAIAQLWLVAFGWNSELETERMQMREVVKCVSYAHRAPLHASPRVERPLPGSIWFTAYDNADHVNSIRGNDVAAQFAFQPYLHGNVDG
jgi:hypothetical protein